VRDRHEPGRQPAASGVESSGLAPRRHEHVLGEFLGSLGVAEDAIAHRIDGPPEARVERPDGILITDKEPLYQPLFLSRE